jgi:hypothetical protein
VRDTLDGPEAAAFEVELELELDPEPKDKVGWN